MRLPVVLALALCLAHCGDDAAEPSPFQGPVRVDLEATRAPMRLSELNLVQWDPETGFAYNDRVVPYDLNTPLFSDYALKDRAIYVPEGAVMTYTDEGVFDLPVGSVIVKSFSFPADFRQPDEDVEVIETRVLIHGNEGWQNWPYIWDEAQEDAILSPAGEVREIDFIDAEGEALTASYLVPQRNQCGACHALQTSPGADETFFTPIGPKARNLNRVFDYGGRVGMRNQLEYLSELGMLTGVPAEVDAAYDFGPIEEAGLAAVPAEDVDRAARDYLDVNCAHCHNPRGVQGQTSQLFLNYDNEDQFRLGFCKRPGSAGEGNGGLTYDIVPGNPAESILVFRTATEEVGAMMPLLGRSLAHDHGVDLLEAWVASLPPQTCEEE
ncbi:MAG: SO2930 family diheme c-type cytochrome [Myxococcota bacterium]